jgi:beta-RFAP synthase
MPRTVQVSAPSRLHFGLFCFAHANGRSFGGIGLMVDRPRVVVKLNSARQWSVRGPAAQPALAWARRALDRFQPTSVRALNIQVLASPSPHTGLGTGTQLALAIATAVRAVCDLPAIPLETLTSAMGRGQRGAVGSYGFQSGGLILEMGHEEEDSLGKLQRRLALPADWQIVLITPRTEQGRHGRTEADAFRQLGTIPQAITNRLLELATGQIIPAAERNDPATFDEAVYQYGLLAGECFTPVQGGPFASDDTARRVKILRHLGIQGVGQSSWGPTLFTLVREDSPDRLIAELTVMPEFSDCHFQVTAPDNRGAVLTVEGELAG